MASPGKGFPTMDSAPSLQVEELAEVIFSQPVKPPRSIQLGLDSPEGSLGEVAEMLTCFTTHGIRILYAEPGEKVKLSEMSEERIETVNSYLNSIGYKLNVQIGGVIPLTREGDHPKLSDHKFHIRGSDGNLFIMSFEHLQ